MSEEYFFIPLSRKQLEVIKDAIDEAARLALNAANNEDLKELFTIQKTWLEIMSSGWTRSYQITWPEGDMSAKIEREINELYDIWEYR